MSIFTQLKQQLNQQINSALGQSNTEYGFICYQVEIAFSSKDGALLNCLNAHQHHLESYPHFYWQDRENTQTIAALGQILTFDDLTQAQQFTQNSQHALIGGLQFEGNCHFLLPRLLLIQKEARLQLSLYFKQEESAIQAVILEQLFASLSFTAKTDFNENKLISQHSAYDFSRWEQTIQQAIQAISTGTLSKVVLANEKTLSFQQPISGYDLLAQSQQLNKGNYHFLLAYSSDTVFLGSSPERLYKRIGTELFTEALAGTVAVTENLEETQANAKWLLADPKNCHENQLVVEDIHQHLKNYVQHFEVSAREIKRLLNVQHLRCRIQATLKPEITDSHCLQQIHPTAAISGLPRLQAKQFITTHEPFQRGWYAGTLGIMSSNYAEFCVTLRSAQIQKNTLKLYAGAGIVAESDPQSEWQEIERKSLTLARLLKS